MGFIYPGPTAWPTSTSVNTEPTTVMQIIEVQTILSDVNKFITDIKLKISSLPVKSRRNVLRSFATILSEVENLIYYIFIRLDRDKKNVFTRVSKNLFFFSDWACIFIWHVYWPYKVPCKISDLWPERPRMATTFCKWILTIKKVIQNALKVELLTLSPWRGSKMLSKMVWPLGF